MIILAWFVIVASAYEIITGPYEIGEPRKLSGPDHYIAQLISSCIYILLAGHVLGWW